MKLKSKSEVGRVFERAAQLLTEKNEYNKTVEHRCCDNLFTCWCIYDAISGGARIPAERENLHHETIAFYHAISGATWFGEDYEVKSYPTFWDQENGFYNERLTMLTMAMQSAEREADYDQA